MPTATAPRLTVAQNATIHSGQLAARIATRSPGPMPNRSRSAAATDAAARRCSMYVTRRSPCTMYSTSPWRAERSSSTRRERARLTNTSIGSPSTSSTPISNRLPGAVSPGSRCARRVVTPITLRFRRDRPHARDAADDDARGAEAPRPRPAGRAVDGRGLPASRVPGTERRQHAALGLGARRRPAAAGRGGRHLPRRHGRRDREEPRPLRPIAVPRHARAAEGRNVGRAPARAPARGARARDPDGARAPGGRRHLHPGQRVGLGAPRGVELHARVAYPRYGQRVDHRAPAPRARHGRAARHPVREGDPGRAVPRRVHDRHRLPARGPGEVGGHDPMEPLVDAETTGRETGRERGVPEYTAIERRNIDTVTAMFEAGRELDRATLFADDAVWWNGLPHLPGLEGKTEHRGIDAIRRILRGS